MGIVKSSATLAVLAGSSIAARRGVPAWDRAIFSAVNTLPDALAPIVWAPMQAGALGAPLAVGALLLVRRGPRDAARTAATGVLAWGAAKVVKRWVGRDRPDEHVDHARLRVGSADKGLGYPSGHAAVAVTLMSAIPEPAHPAWRTVGVLLALTVGASRVYVGAHYPLDVIGGWILGATILDTTRAADLLVSR